MSDQITHKIESIEGLANLSQWMIHNVTKGLAGGPVMVTLHRDKSGRSNRQNAKFHPMIRDILTQIDHPAKKILGTDEDQWRYYLIAIWGNQIMLPSLDGDKLIVLTDKRSSELTAEEAASFIEYLYSEGAKNGIQWSEPSLKTFEQYREAGHA